MRDQVQRVLAQMRLLNGLYVASPSPHYNYVWIRDTCYAALSEQNSENGRFEQTCQAVLDIFHHYRWKIEHHSQHRPHSEFEYIHPRYTRDTFEELTEPWGNAQNDAIGLFLYAIGKGVQRGKKMFRDESDKEMVQLLVHYLVTLEFWADADNGVWEEQREVHASSIGACVAGLLAVAPFVTVQWDWIRSGLGALLSLLPRESATKSCDLAQLSLIYPYQLLGKDIGLQIVSNVERQLVRQNGVIRYAGDRYFAESAKEAEWCLGFAWLGLCHLILGNARKAREYLMRMETTMLENGAIPELYLPESGKANENTPLAWAQSMYLQLYDALEQGSSVS